MSSKYKINNPDGIYFLTLSVVQWIDVFTRPVYKHILTDNLNYCVEKKGLTVFAWVIMSNHIHLVCKSKGENNLSDIVRDFKKYSSVKIIDEFLKNPEESRKNWIIWMLGAIGQRNINNKNYQLWQQNNHPIELYNNKLIEQKIDYIHMNPVKAEIVQHPEEYIYSSARDYAGEKGLVKIELIE